MNGKQFGFWKMRRRGSSNIKIANLRGISRQAVYRALIVMDDRIDATLWEMAHANLITVAKINAERGILLGQSILFQTAAVIFVSEKHCMKVWYEHDGNCGACQRYTECIDWFWDYAPKLGIRIEKTPDPTEMSEELFTSVEVLV
ncbi:MAG: hypothetical protein WCF90_11070 [Methanomicrobiales archaeon]